VIASSVIVASGCGAKFEPLPAEGGAGGAPTSGGGGAVAAGSGGTGGQAATSDLVNRGLVARYFIDDGEEKTVPDTLHDAAEPAVDLAVKGEDVAFDSAPGTNALAWTMVGTDDRASAPIDGTKIHDRLHGANTATMEIVLQFEAVADNRTRLFHIGFDTEPGRFSLLANEIGTLQFHKGGNNNNPHALWPVSIATRSVIHLVYDTTRANVGERIRLWHDGELAAANDELLTPLEANEALDFSTGRHFVLGNREIGGRAGVGKIFYAAMYDVALEQNEIDQNVAILSAYDDGP
jgi:hypothetical protein